MDILIGFLTVVHLLVAALMVVLVLMQKSKDQGVGAAFGGGMTDTMFGAGTTSALVRMTIWCACIFLAGSLVLSVLHARRNERNSGSLMEKVIEGQTGTTGAVSTVPTLPTAEPDPASAEPVSPAAAEDSAAISVTTPTAPVTEPAPATTPATGEADK